MTKRVKWIDCAKGIAAELVLIGHFVPVIKLQTFIYSFHMPLFFFLAGTTFKNQQLDFKIFLKKKFIQIMIPYYIFVLPMFIMKFFQDIQEKNINLMIKHFIGIFLCWKGTSLYSGVWFLPCMFIVYILAWGIQLKNIFQKILIISILAIIGFILPKANVTLPFGADTALVALLFFELGILMKRYEKIIDKKYMIFYSITYALSILNFRLCGHRIELYSCDYGYIILFIITSLSGIIGTIALSKSLINISLLEKIGKSAIYLYGAQLIPLSVIYYKKLHINGNTITRLSIGILTVITIREILLFIKPLYDILFVKCCRKLKLDK